MKEHQYKEGDRVLVLGVRKGVVRGRSIGLYSIEFDDDIKGTRPLIPGDEMERLSSLKELALALDGTE